MSDIEPAVVMSADGPNEPEWKRCEHHWVWHSGPMIERGVSVAQCSLCGHLRADASRLAKALAASEARIAEAAGALREVGKKAIVVKPMLDKPYDEEPGSSPWSRYLGPAARRAYNLGCELSRAALADQPEQRDRLDSTSLGS